MCPSWPGVWNWRTECAGKNRNVTSPDGIRALRSPKRHDDRRSRKDFFGIFKRDFFFRFHTSVTNQSLVILMLKAARGNFCTIFVIYHYYSNDLLTFNINCFNVNVNVVNQNNNFTFSITMLNIFQLSRYFLKNLNSYSFIRGALSMNFLYLF